MNKYNEFEELSVSVFSLHVGAVHGIARSCALAIVFAVCNAYDNIWLYIHIIWFLYERIVGIGPSATFEFPATNSS